MREGIERRGRINACVRKHVAEYEVSEFGSVAAVERGQAYSLLNHW